MSLAETTMSQPGCTSHHGVHRGLLSTRWGADVILQSFQPSDLSSALSRGGINCYCGHPSSYEQNHMLSVALVSENERPKSSATNTLTPLLAGKRAKRPATM